MYFQSILNKFVKIIGLGSYSRTFAGVPCFTSRVGELKNRAALTLPGIGIFVHPDDITNISLLRHEYGHVLQARAWGMFFFYRSVAWTSLWSARKSNHDPKHIHQKTWTEWSANKLAYNFFNRPLDWDTKAYPINPP